MVAVAASVLAPVAIARQADGAGPAAQTHGCSVSLTPADATDEWQAAARSVEDRLRRTEAGGDCGALGIEVAGPHALVAFTTLDGRQTVRPVESPAEIGPLVDALLVTIPARQPQGGERPPAGTPAVDRVPPQPAATAARIVVNGAAGVRLSSPGGFASPSIGASAGVLAGAWELSAFGRFDPTYAVLLGGAPAAFKMNRYAVGVAASRRVALGAVAVPIGLSTGVAVTSETASGTTNGGPTGDGQASGGPTGNVDSNAGQASLIHASAAEPLVGAFAGIVYPRRSHVRIRSDLAGEIVPSHIGRTLGLDPALLPLSWWSASASVGVEWEVP
jgi:hypothetical protein